MVKGSVTLIYSVTDQINQNNLEVSVRDPSLLVNRTSIDIDNTYQVNNNLSFFIKKLLHKFESSDYYIYIL